VDSEVANLPPADSHASQRMEISINIHIRDLLAEDHRETACEKATVIRVEQSLRSAQFPSRRHLFNCNNGGVKAATNQDVGKDRLFTESPSPRLSGRPH
jgi:hypothetical protein